MCYSFDTRCAYNGSYLCVCLWVLYDYCWYNIDMYASDLTHKKRAAAIYKNSQLQKEWFASGGTIRILGQKGGNDYSYMTQLEEGCVQDECWKLYVPLNAQAGNSSEPLDLGNIQQMNLGATDATGNSIIYDAGYGQATPHLLGGIPVIDDGSIRIPMVERNFFFNGIDYGASSNIYWNTNGAITFGPIGDPHVVSLSAGSVPAVLIGNYDRLTSKFYYSNYNISNNRFGITKVVVFLADYYTDTTGLDVGQYQIRFIKEFQGAQRQWIEVTVIRAPPSPGYSNNPTVTYISGTQKDAAGNTINQDSNGLPIDSTKNSPWDITNGTAFLNLLGNKFSTAHPPTGTTILYNSDREGKYWNASVGSHLNYY